MAARKTVAGTPADPLVRYHSIELDGETYHLTFDFNAIATAESVAGVNLLQVLDLNGLTAAQYRGMFYAALMKGHPDITLARAGSLVTLPNLKAITDGLFAAWRLAMPGSDEAEENPRGAASEKTSAA